MLMAKPGSRGPSCSICDVEASLPEYCRTRKSSLAAFSSMPSAQDRPGVSRAWEHGLVYECTMNVSLVVRCTVSRVIDVCSHQSISYGEMLCLLRAKQQRPPCWFLASPTTDVGAII